MNLFTFQIINRKYKCINFFFFLWDFEQTNIPTYPQKVEFFSDDFDETL